jgi:cob(I)alamin adenosyltransferase
LAWVSVKIYTKSGDDGTTGLLGPGRVTKDSARIDAYGCVDELNAMLGMVRAAGLDKDLDGLLERVQGELFIVGAALADPRPGGPFHSAVTADRIEALEHAIDELEAGLPELTQFILPAGTTAAAQLHLARTVCRRAERGITRLAREPEEQVPGEIPAYLNRLSDLLFVMARVANQRAGRADTPWGGIGSSP